MSKLVENPTFTGVWFPAKLWLDQNLSHAEKLLWGEIQSLDKEFGCVVKNAHFQIRLGLKDRQIKRLIASLEQKKYILRFFDAEGNRTLKINYASFNSEIPDFLKRPNGVSKKSPHDKKDTAGVSKKSPIRDTYKRFKNPPISSEVDQAEKTRGEEEELRKFLNLWPEYRPTNPEKIAELAGLLRETLEREGLTRQELFTKLKERRAIFENWTEKEKKYRRGLRTILFSELWKDDSFWQSRVSPEVRKAERAAQIADEEHRRALEAGEVKRKMRDELSPLTAEFFEICKAGKFRPHEFDKKTLQIIDNGTFGDFEKRISAQYGTDWEKYFAVFHETAQRLKKEAERQAA